MSICYLIHFERPLHHAQHYLGTTRLDLDDRLERHRDGRGAALLRAVTLAGIAWKVVRTWKGGRDMELKLKRRKRSPAYCPVCHPARGASTEVG